MPQKTKTQKVCWMMTTKNMDSDYRFPNLSEIICIFIFIFGVFIYEIHEGYVWARQNQITDAAECEQVFSTQDAFRWFRYFSKAGCEYYLR
jgi:hypothetical protein